MLDESGLLNELERHAWGGGCRLVLAENLHKELYIKEILQETKGS